MFQNMGNSTEQTTWFLKYAAEVCGGRYGEENPKREGTHRLRDMRCQLNVIFELVCQLEVKQNYF